MERSKTVKVNTSNVSSLTDGIEISNNRVALKDIRPDGSFFFVSFADDLNDKWFDSLHTTSIITSEGTTDSSGLFLDSTQVLKYGFQDNYSGNQKTIDFTYTPNYSGYPTNDITILSLSADVDPLIGIETYRDLITITHDNDGYLTATVVNSSGTLIARAATMLNATASTKYNICITIDNTVSVGQQVIKIYIDGVNSVLYSDSTGIKLTGDSLFDNTNLTLGSTFTGTVVSHSFYVGYIALFTSLVYTSNYIIPSTYPSTIYSTDEQSFILSTSIQTDRLVSLDGFTFEGNVKLNMVVSDDVLYEKTYDATAGRWEIADGTIAGANSYSDITEVNLYHLYHKPYKLYIKIYMQSPDGYETAYFDNTVITFNFYLIDIPTVNYTLVYGLISGLTEQKRDFRVTAILNANTVYGGKIEMYPETKEAVTDGRMYWELLLPTTDDMTSSTYYQITINTGDSNEKTVNVKVPFIDTIEFEELSSIYAYTPTY